MNKNKIFSIFVILALLMAAIPALPVGASGTVTVNSADVGVTWFTSDTRPGGSSSFESGPGSPPLGNGSLKMTTTDTMGGSSQAKAQFFNYQYGSFGTPGNGIALADIDEMSYWAYRASTSTNPAAQTISLNMEVDYIGDGTGYTTLVFEPIYNPGQGAMATDTWQKWDAFNSGNAVWWSTKNIPGVCAFNCFVSWNTVVANNPNAEIVSAFGFNIGSGWVGDFEGYADALTFGVTGDSTTYDFEPVTQCTSICYADVNTGNDANGGSSPSDAKKTIQAAIDQVDSGGTVIVAAGTYTENLDIAKPLTIQGAGKGTNPSFDTIIDASGGSYGILMHRPADLMGLRVAGASLDGIRVYKLASDARLNFANATWQNITSSANAGKGVEIHNDTDVSNLTIINSEFIGNTGQGFRTASNDTVDGLTITDSLFNQNSYGIYLQGTINNLNISGSSFSDSTIGHGAYLSETGPVTNMAIEESEFNNNYYGLVFYNTQDNSNITISGTDFQGNDKSGVWMYGNTLTDVLIQESNILNNDASASGAYGINIGVYDGIMNNVAVHYSNITGHTIGGGLMNGSGSETTQVNGTCNWWGAADGPSGSGLGSGDAVTDYVTFTPWLISAAPDGACTGMPDNEGPITTNVVADPNPAAVGSLVTVTANVDDITTGGSNIASAEYSLDSGPWTAMSASDGTFDEVSEDVTASFIAPSEPGIYDLCVRGTDEPGNIGEAECIMFVVYDPAGGFVTGGGWIDSPEGALTTAPSLVWNQDFSTDDAGWLDSNDEWYGSIVVDNGLATFYGDSDSAPFSRFDGYRDFWPGTWIAEIDVYLDPSWPSGQGFDYSVAATGSDGDHQRDYIFHVGVVEDYGPITGRALLVNGSNNADFQTNPYKLVNDNGGDYYEVASAGWYTLQHVFRDAGGYLAVDLNLLDAGGNTLWTATRENVADTIPGEVGGNRYAWFTHIDVADGIQVDNHQLFVPPNPTGKATFGFVAKYKKGASVPDGNTEFQFKAGDLNFHSTSYEWLVVTGSDFAKFKGEGTINGEGNYKFQIWAGDGSPDTFRIKIWYEDNGNEIVVYDNGMNQEIGGGSIVVHKK